MKIKDIKAGGWIRIHDVDDVIELAKVQEFMYDKRCDNGYCLRYGGRAYFLMYERKDFEYSDNVADLIKKGERVIELRDEYFICKPLTKDEFIKKVRRKETTTEWERNAFRCRKCGMVVESKSVHDFQQCKCGNFTDGGLDYIRRGGKIEDMEDLSEPHAYFGKKADTLSGDRFAEKEKGAVETFNKVKVTYHKATGLLCIDDYDTDEQLAIFYVTEED